MAEKTTVFNPFSIGPYLGPEYFCDRKTETQELHNALLNGRNITLLSPRRMGKTGLIRHLFEQIPAQEASCFYVDIYQTKNMHDFTKALAEAVISQRMTPFAERVSKEIMQFFGALRPVFSPDPITGMMQCTIDLKPQEEEITLQQVFDYLEHAPQRCYVAIDEFQEIANYPDGKAEAILRSHIQHMKNVNFIFAGSKKHIMAEMFLSPKRPFYQSTQLMSIDAIEEEAYFEFAYAHLSAHGQQIEEPTFHTLYSIMNGHTWYVQALLNRIYQNHQSSITDDTIRLALNQWITENSIVYETYCRLITDRQLAVLKAVAKEGVVAEPGSSAFLQKYQLGAYSTVRSALASLEDKELIYRDTDGKYSVYDRFFELWLR